MEGWRDGGTDEGREEEYGWGAVMVVLLLMGICAGAAGIRLAFPSPHEYSVLT